MKAATRPKTFDGRVDGARERWRRAFGCRYRLALFAHEQCDQIRRRKLVEAARPGVDGFGARVVRNAHANNACAKRSAVCAGSSRKRTSEAPGKSLASRVSKRNDNKLFSRKSPPANATRGELSANPACVAALFASELKSAEALCTIFDDARFPLPAKATTLGASAAMAAISSGRA